MVTVDVSLMRRFLDPLTAVDRALFDRVAGRQSSVSDAVLPRLTRAADHGKLWWALAAALAATGRPRNRRAALRGVLAVSMASPAANVLGKGLVRRSRPAYDGVPLARLLRRYPTSSSMPSGHSASAAAFATAVLLEDRRFGLPAAGLAAAVGLSRVHAGVHYPADVLAGFLLGVGAAFSTTHLLPRRPAEPARGAPPRAEAPALTDGSGLVLVVNAGSGATRHGHEPAADVRAQLPAAEVVEAAGESFEAAVNAAAASCAVLGIAGGDGSVQAAAAAALTYGRPLAVFPSGTLDHFAADVGLGNVADTIQALRDGEAVAVDVGSVDAGTGGAGIFLNNASVGGYPQVVAIREQLERRLGKWPALAIALVRVLRRDQPIQALVNGRHRRLWLLFAGNGCYLPTGFAPSYRPRLDAGELDVRLVDAAAPFARTRLVVAMLVRRLPHSSVYEERAVPAVTVEATTRPLRLARDGEVDDAKRSSVTLGVRRGALTVYRPADATRP